MKLIGKRKHHYHKKGFNKELNDFFKLCIKMRKNKTYIPNGIYRFETFEEADEWKMKILFEKAPKQGHRP